MSEPRAAFVTEEWGGVTRGGIGEVVRAEVERDPARALVLVDASRSVVERIRQCVPDGVAVERASELARDMLPRRAFPSQAHWRSHRLWLALTSLAVEGGLDRIEFPDFDGSGFVAVKARRLGVGAALPPISIRLHGTVARVAAADERPLLSLADKHRVAMERYTLRHADRIIAPSEAVLAEYLAAGPLASDRVVSPPPFSMPSRATLVAPSAPPLRIGFLGKLQPLKGPETLVRAAVRVLRERGGNALEVHLVGADEAGRLLATHGEELRRLVPSEYADRIRFHGALPRAQALRRMGECHAAVVPSRTETFGLAARELAAIGLPLAVTDLGAFRDLEQVGGGASIDRFPVDDVGALAEVIDGWWLALKAAAWPPPGHAFDPGTVRSPDSPEACEPAEVPGPVPSTREDRLVSVVIPYYEMQAHLGPCLESVAADPHPSKEVIVVDDGTPTSEGRRALEGIAASFEACALRVVRKENGGLASARNAGLAVARGDYVLPLDPDDLIVPGYLGTAVAVLEAHPELDWVNGVSASFDEARDPSQPEDWVVPYDPEPGMLLYENGCGTAAAVFRRETLMEFAYREDLPAYEDWDLQLRLAFAGRVGEGLPEVFHRYRRRRGGLAAAAHVHHADLLSRVVSPHLAGLPAEVRSAFEVYLASATELRGLGGTRAGLAGALYDRVAMLYRRRLKDALGAWVGEARRDRWIHALRRRYLEASASRRRDR